METTDRPGPSPAAARKSRKAAISAMCASCIYDSTGHGTWRQQVAACTALDCPLWMHRPLPAPGAPAWPSQASAALAAVTGWGLDVIERWRSEPLRSPR